MSIETLIDYFGGVTKAANALGVSQSLVSLWRSRGVPAERCPAIERSTNGQVRCEDLRPDIDWAVLRGTCPPEQRVTDPIQSLADASFARHLGEHAEQQKEAA